MLAKKKRQSTAYCGIKLASYYMTKAEITAFLAGLIKTNFFDNMSERICI